MTLNWRFLTVVLIALIVNVFLWWGLIVHFGPIIATLAVMALICYVLIKF